MILWWGSNPQPLEPQALHVFQILKENPVCFPNLSPQRKTNHYFVLNKIARISIVIMNIAKGIHSGANTHHQDKSISRFILREIMVTVIAPRIKKAIFLFIIQWFKFFCICLISRLVLNISRIIAAHA
ncbi:MAG: hypothetical protein BGO40_02820 [Chryseobacterium sp. 39-10]|nr:MAG: hypothetical protein BGO40_02820 [Chryseobacterium sp. 39-10]